MEEEKAGSIAVFKKLNDQLKNDTISKERYEMEWSQALKDRLIRFRGEIKDEEV